MFEVKGWRLEVKGESIDVTGYELRVMKNIVGSRQKAVGSNE